MTEKFPAKGYKENVLKDCFSDAKKYFLHHILNVNRAHLIMLGEQNIISSEELNILATAIQSLNTEAISDAKYDGSVEDLFFFIQREISNACDDKNAAGKLHTARSRNDIDVTIYRLYLRNQTLELIDSVMKLRNIFFGHINKHHDSLMPAYTHTQPAQPTTIAHFLLAMTENLNRDTKRLQEAFINMNECPLGACAITTTGFPIDRKRVSDLLGFYKPSRNSYGSIASVDYFTELMGAVSVLLVNIGKFAQEFLQMATMEFDVIRLPDGYVQISSIMPQKRNPVAIEHVRAIASKALGQTLGIFTSVHNTPFGDINDVEDDLQPAIYNGSRDAIRAVSLMGHTLSAAEFNIDLLKERSESNYITVTELADVLVRMENFSFHLAHSIVSDCVKESISIGEDINLQLLKKITRKHNKEISLSKHDLEKTLSAENFIKVRDIYGGPAPKETRSALSEQQKQYKDDVKWIEDVRLLLKNADEELFSEITDAVTRKAGR